uniref:NADH-ubiquinone oxidoreductase chain 3 n=1 Tax=Trichinella pseudospiralis TaxID=6337 RepID=A0A0A0V090_TRIPS|nr:NADH dehydrogenase subunit 3 [Trichinella pseudospiralis]AIW56914.1 NADH dehydrogenase subunit 3 [Trichinella pseudospiralis]
MLATSPMIVFSYLVFFGLVVVLLMLLMRSVLSKNYFNNTLSFECGFESYKTNRLPFSINFFMVSLIFVLFDLEIIILIAYIPNMTSLTFLSYITASSFLLFMLLSLMFEWALGKLSWIF